MYRAGERPGGQLAVSTAGLTKSFGNRTVVDDVALAIPAGSVCGFVGPNGAGKTTTIRMLLGLVRPTAGSGIILGGSLDEPASYLHKVGALIESPAFYPQLSGRDNLKVLARLGRLPLTAVDPVLERSGLIARAGDKYRSYSLGMKQRLGIAAAMLAGPELLILDEPTNGLDPAGIVEMRGLIRSFAQDGITVLVSSHLISEIEQICDHVVMIRAGRLVHQGSVGELRATQHPEFLVAAEYDADRDVLIKLLQAADCTVTPRPAEAAVLVETPGLGAADLNRLAAGGGITLRQLSERTLSLERAFFALTGTASADVPAGQEMGAIK
jgi:ABC-2 type transport system ATP-binding protein